MKKSSQFCKTSINKTYRMDYCNRLYMRLSLKSIQKLQLMLNRIAWTVMGASEMAHDTPLLHKLHWLDPVYFWVQFRILGLTLKALHGMGPNYLRASSQLYLSTPSDPSRKLLLLRKSIWCNPRNTPFCCSPCNLEHNST